MSSVTEEGKEQTLGMSLWANLNLHKSNNWHRVSTTNGEVPADAQRENPKALTPECASETNTDSQVPPWKTAIRRARGEPGRLHL